LAEFEPAAATFEPPEEDRVLLTVTEGVADVRLNRPAKLNALDATMFERLAEVGARIAADPSVRAVVLSGEGRGFCAGLDFSAFTEMADGSGGAGITRRLGHRPAGQIANRGQQSAHIWSEVPVPVIAALHGVALGGGLQIALGADIRIVSPDARLSVLEMRWGLVPDMTGTWTLPRLVGLDVAKELTWTGRMVDGEEAVRIGLATRLAPDPLVEAQRLASELAARNPHAVRAAKRLLDGSGAASRQRQYLDESSEMAHLIGSPNQVEAVAAYFEKRRPVFSDPG
jgi:enoyl-CoA hydratase/carnithine racemase